jgi:hypothetical protein
MVGEAVSRPATRIGGVVVGMSVIVGRSVAVDDGVHVGLGLAGIVGDGLKLGCALVAVGAEDSPDSANASASPPMTRHADATAKRAATPS